MQKLEAAAAHLAGELFLPGSGFPFPVTPLKSLIHKPGFVLGKLHSWFLESFHYPQTVDPTQC